MYKSTARGEQFFERSGSESTKGSRRGFGLLGGGESPLALLSQEQSRDSLVAKYKSLSAELTEVKKGKDKRRLMELGRQLSELGRQINAMRPRKCGPSNVAQHFVDICRETMTKAQFNTIMGDANHRAESQPEE